MTGENDDTSILGSGNIRFIHVVWNRDSKNRYLRTLLVGGLIYLGFFLSAQTHAADVCGGVWPNPTSTATMFADLSPQADGNYYNFYCATTNESQAACGVSFYTSRVTIIADNGEGRLYMTDDLSALPRIFMKETTEAPTQSPIQPPSLAKNTIFFLN